MTPTKVSGQFQAGREDGNRHAAYCAHCAEPLAGLRIVQREIGGQRKSFCCLGCAFIAEQIALARSRLGRAAEAAGAADGEQAVQQVARSQIEIRGMVCAACAFLIETRLRATPGVTVANVDFVARRATVVFDRNRVTSQALAQVKSKMSQ